MGYYFVSPSEGWDLVHRALCLRPKVPAFAGTHKGFGNE